MIKNALHIIGWLVLIISVQVTYCKADANNPPPLPLIPEIFVPGCYDSGCTPLYSVLCSMKGWHYDCSLPFPGSYSKSCACLLITASKVGGCYCLNNKKAWVASPIPSCPIVIDPTRYNGSMSNIDGVLTCDIGAGCYSLTCLKKHPNQQARCQKSNSYCEVLYPGDYLKNCACAWEKNNTLQCQCETSKNHWEKVPVPDDCIGKFMYYQGGMLQCDKTSAPPQTATPVKPGN